MGMTELGKMTYRLVCSYGLGAFYNEFMGNLLINQEELTLDVLGKINRFLIENRDWVLGYEDCGDGKPYMWLNTRDSLNG